MLTKRDFLKTTLLSTACVAMTSCKVSQNVVPRKIVGDWAWLRINPGTPDSEFLAHLKALKNAGVSGIFFEQYSEPHYKLAHNEGFQVWRWKWTLNRFDEFLKNHKDWYMVNRKGESCFDKPLYVDYYHFLCPNNPELIKYLCDDYKKEAQRPYVDGVHLDYIRYPDVILPVSLWKNYNITQQSELPEYDTCYCERCRKLFSEKTGQDPLKMQYPDQSQSWRNFRYNSITRVVNEIVEAVHSIGKPISAAVFPGVEPAKRLVRQNWTEWKLDAFFPMLYNGFYEEDENWILDSIRESKKIVQAPIYAGIFCPDFPEKHKLENVVKKIKTAGADGVAYFDDPFGTKK